MPSLLYAKLDKLSKQPFNSAAFSLDFKFETKTATNILRNQLIEKVLALKECEL